MEVGTENDLAALSNISISKMVAELEEENELERHLPGGGYIHMSDTLPYLVIYRFKDEEKNEDRATMRFVLSEASFMIIGNKDFKGYQRLLYSLGEKMASKFKTFLMLELYTGPNKSNQFKVKGPQDKLPTTLTEFKKDLDNLNNKYQVLPLEPTIIIDTEERQKPGELPLLEIEELKEAGCLVLGLEVPPVYLNNQGEEFPVFFRKFKDDLVLAIHKTIFEFIRVQTSGGVSSYRALGRKSLKKKVLEIDRKLANIETSYQFLWLISPANIRQIKKTFFETKFQKVLNYHYRLLPMDPDVLKRELYNLKIEEIDDPALSFLLREKREELDLQITMLNERGNKNFYYNSLMLYHGVEKELDDEAVALLHEVDEVEKKDYEHYLSAEDFKNKAEEEFDYFRTQDENFTSKVHIRDDVNILMVSRGELYIPNDYKMGGTETNALIQHEVGTHVLTFYNGSQQPLKQLSTGLTDYEILQEGLAVLSEYLVGGLTANRMRTLAGRVVASAALIKGGDFIEIFNLLHREYHFSEQRAFNITSRIMQGGGFIKDIIYLKGIVQLKKYLEEGGELEPLLIGKFALRQLPTIKELSERKVLKKARILPRYLEWEESKNKLSKIREGISLSQMISA
ncbi:MAG TPA: tyrosine/phenylalanine carboxypeptidase domain-containing protein [Salinimicrobium sp.]|nr:tyrosine/phenylalanine carboxypeptidase domain-containing protein [Salinimicrobium sp.]